MMRKPLALIGLCAALSAVVACSASDGGRYGSTYQEIEAQVGGAAGADPGPLLATIPASPDSVATWAVYATTTSDGKSSLTIRGLDGNDNVVNETVLLPDTGVAGVGSIAGLEADAATTLGQAMASDIAAYVAQNDDGTTSNSANGVRLQNIFGFSACTFDILKTIGSAAGTVWSVVGAFSACPVTVGVGCVAGVVMTVTGVATTGYEVDQAVSDCKTQPPPPPISLCQAACGQIGSTYPTCMSGPPFNTCYSDCSNGSDSARSGFASCVTSTLATDGGTGGDGTGDDGGADGCSALTSCFDF
jgi:hypothetical protein